MTFRVRTHSDASTELAEAVRWYESRRTGLGSDLLDEVAGTIERVAQNPEIGSSLSADQNTRRLFVTRFPYQLVYRLRTDEVVIVAVAHLKRRPGYWKHRR